jgi:hypothetical protein
MYFPGATANLTKLPTSKEQLKLGSHQMVKRLFNSEVNLVSDCVLVIGEDFLGRPFLAPPVKGVAESWTNNMQLVSGETMR